MSMAHLVDNARLSTSHEDTVITLLKPLHLTFQLHTYKHTQTIHISL